MVEPKLAWDYYVFSHGLDIQVEEDARRRGQLELEGVELD